MRTIRQFAFLIAAAALLAAAQAVTVAAAEPAPDPAQIGRDEAHLEGLEGEISSIGDRLKQLENQSATARAQRARAQAEVDRLDAAARGLLPRIEAQAADYERKKAALKAAIANDYQRRQPGAVMMLAESGSVSETMARAKYGNIVSTHAEQLAHEAEEAARKLRDQKEEFDAQKRDAELARRQVDEISAGLASQEAESKELLANRSNEAAYVSARIARAKAIQQKLLDAASEPGGNATWGTFTNGAAVKAGDVIGFEGSTGYSTGCHTHFSAIKNGRWVNPQLYLDGGILSRPGGRITQGYGMTDWARSGAYGGGIHNGVDYVQGCSRPVRAAADGTIVRDARNDGSGFGHYVMIRHADGLITLYGHLV